MDSIYYRKPNYQKIQQQSKLKKESISSSISSPNISVELEDGVLTHAIFNGNEIIHEPSQFPRTKKWNGWDKSEIVMFPNVCLGSEGKVQEWNYRLGKNGLSHSLKWNEADKKNNEITFIQDYARQASVFNKSSNPARNKPSFVSFPFSFQLMKTLHVTDKELVARFNVKNSGKEKFPYQIGWSPAFKRTPSQGTGFEYDGKFISFRKVKKATADGGLIIKGTNNMTYLGKDEEVTIQTRGFNHFRIWSPAANMYCMQPLSHTPNCQPFSNSSMLNKGEVSKTYSTRISAEHK